MRGIRIMGCKKMPPPQVPGQKLQNNIITQPLLNIKLGGVKERGVKRMRVKGILKNSFCFKKSYFKKPLEICMARLLTAFP